MMGGIVGRLFREFAVTLSVAILVSLGISLTTTPMMCSRLLRHAIRMRSMADYSAPASAPSIGSFGVYERTLRLGPGTLRA